MQNSGTITNEDPKWLQEWEACQKRADDQRRDLEIRPHFVQAVINQYPEIPCPLQKCLFDLPTVTLAHIAYGERVGNRKYQRVFAEPDPWEW